MYRATTPPPSKKDKVCPGAPMRTVKSSSFEMVRVCPGAPIKAKRVFNSEQLSFDVSPSHETARVCPGAPIKAKREFSYDHEMVVIPIFQREKVCPGAPRKAKRSSGSSEDYMNVLNVLGVPSYLPQVDLHLSYF
jgi:hypothetical protein